MIKTHNYYIDFLKAFNSFLLKIFNPEVLKSKSLQKIEYNIGSKTLLKHNLYGEESYEFPNAIIDLQDIKVAEGVSTIARNAYGLFSSPETTILCDNNTRNEVIHIETQRYLLNFNVQINVESNSDLFNFYHIITNNIPVNYTFVDYKFYYFIDVTEFCQDWDFIKDDTFNVIKMPDPTERDKVKYFSMLLVQPQLELQGVVKNEDKENNKYSITLSILAAVQIPILLYGNNYTKIDRIIFNVNMDYSTTDYPVLIDIDINEYNKVKKSIILNRNNFKEIFEEIESTDNENDKDETKEKYKIFKGYQLEIQGDLSNKLLSLYFNPDVVNTVAPITFIPLNSKETNKSTYEIIFDKDNNITIINIFNYEAELIKKYFNEQYKKSKETNLELIQLFINN